MRVGCQDRRAARVRGAHLGARRRVPSGRRPRPGAAGRSATAGTATSSICGVRVWSRSRPQLLGRSAHRPRHADAAGTRSPRTASSARHRASSRRSSTRAWRSRAKPRTMRSSLACTRRRRSACRQRGCRVRRVVMDYELKRDYQRFLQETKSSGRRTARDDRIDRRKKIRAWADAHGLPIVAGARAVPGRAGRVRARGRPSGSRGSRAGDRPLQQPSDGREAGVGLQCSPERSEPAADRQARRRGGSPFDPHAAERVLR